MAETLRLSGAGTRTVAYRVPRPVWDEVVISGELARRVNDLIIAEMAKKGWRKARIGKRMFWFREDDLRKAEE